MGKQRYTRVYQGIQRDTIRYTGVYRDIQGYTRVYQVWRLRRLTRKFNDPKVQDFKSGRGEAFRDYFLCRKTQKVKNHGEPKLTVNGDLFRRKTINSTERPKCQIDQLKRPAKRPNDQTTVN